jgi:hypothetical protein
MNAEDDSGGGAIEEPGPDNITNPGLDSVIIIPLIALKDSFGQTFGKLDPTPAPGALQHGSVRVPRGVIVNIIGHIEPKTR